MCHGIAVPPRILQQGSRCSNWVVGFCARHLSARKHLRGVLLWVHLGRYRLPCNWGWDVGRERPAICWAGLDSLPWFPKRGATRRDTSNGGFATLLWRHNIGYTGIERSRSPGRYNVLERLNSIARVARGEVGDWCRVGLDCRAAGVQVTRYVIIGDAVSVEETAELTVLLSHPPSGLLDFRGCLDALELVDPKSLLELLEILSSASPRPPLVVSYPGKIGLLLWRRKC